jgi:hypothetical protein
MLRCVHGPCIASHIAIQFLKNQENISVLKTTKQVTSSNLLKYKKTAIKSA